VDLVAHDEDAMWSCVRDLVERFGAMPQGISVMRGETTHYGVALRWPAEEPYADKPMGADVTTCAFAGNFDGVPIRVEALDDDDLCAIFAVAEERFQRKFRLKDLLDLLVLAEVTEDRFGGQLPALLSAYAQELNLAPELAQLIAKADDWVPVSPLWTDMAEGLKPLAEKEKAARAGRRMHTLNYGLPLNDRRSEHALIQERAGGDILTTPIGTCLLVGSPVVDASDVAEALAFIEGMGPPARPEGPAAVTSPAWPA
jgi:hypothetical protein